MKIGANSPVAIANPLYFSMFFNYFLLINPVRQTNSSVAEKKWNNIYCEHCESSHRNRWTKLFAKFRPSQCKCEANGCSDSAYKV